MRDLPWEGCWNARDLGGLRTTQGEFTRFHRVVRADALHALTDAAWSAAWAHGVRTVVDLRNRDQADRAPTRPPAGIALVHAPLEDGLDGDDTFRALRTSGAWATSLYLAAFLRAWPERVAEVLARVDEAAPGAVVVHCSKGCDRTGLVALALLVIAGVEPDLVVADYEHTAARLREHGARHGWEDDAPALDRVYRALGSSPRAGVLDALSAVPLLLERLGPARVARLEARLLAPPRSRPSGSPPA
jgi:hypothetical protein